MISARAFLSKQRVVAIRIYRTRPEQSDSSTVISFPIVTFGASHSLGGDQRQEYLHERRR
jgi:hypothetical protein